MRGSPNGPAKQLWNLLADYYHAHITGPTVHRGYSWPGLEKVSQYVHQEGQDLDAEDTALRQIQDCKVSGVSSDSASSRPQGRLLQRSQESYEIGSERNQEQPNVWLPEDVLPGFRSFMTTFYCHLHAVATEVLRAIALGLGLADDTDSFLRVHSGLNNQLRLLHYPPVETAQLTSNMLARMPAHSDWSTLTMLFQDDCGGLQVEHPTCPGQFVDATPVRNALVMNVGDLLMRWSNDQLKSTLHRVALPPPQRGAEGDAGVTRARYSIPYFVAPDPQAVIECLPVCAGPDNSPKYPPVTQQDYSRMRAQLQYSDKSPAPDSPSR